MKREIRILLVDDHRLFREGVKRILEMEPGLVVIGECGDGEAALQKAKELKADVILMDINMPSLNGVDATPTILELSPDSKVIILSIHDDEHYVYKALRSGASGYLLKEMDSESLIEAVRTVAEGDSYIHPKVTGRFIEEYRRLAEQELMAVRIGEIQRDGIILGKEEWELLTPREREVLELISKGKSNRAIGEILFISEKTVKNHVSSILMKMGVEDRTQAVVTAIKNGWVTL